MKMMRSLMFGLLAACLMCFGFSSFASAAPPNIAGLGQSFDHYRVPPLFVALGSSSGIMRPGLVGHKMVKTPNGAASVASYSLGSSRVRWLHSPGLFGIAALGKFGADDTGV